MPSLLEFAQSLQIEALADEPMSRHTTFKIGGPADCMVFPDNVGCVGKLISFCVRNDTPYLILGNGSNLLVSEKGIRGMVISVKKMDDIVCEGEDIRCDAGARLSDICKYALSKGLSGLEFAYGIPGTIGGAVNMNAGAYGGEMKDVVYESRHRGRDGEGAYSGDELCFSYRSSAYTGSDKIITSVGIHLHLDDPDRIAKRMDEFLERRKSKQPLEFPSAGSVFKRPVGHFAGTLIESCGLKGLRHGGAVVSDKHAGFIINTGGATYEDVRWLIEKIKNEVLKKTGVTLECEIKLI